MTKALPLALRLLIAAIFLAGGISKLYHMELTELVVAETKWFSWTMTEVLARLLAGFEITWGFLIVFNPFKRNLVHRGSIVLLLLFTLFLGVQMLLRGSSEDCGCFPGLVSISPVIAIVRNVLLLGLCLVLVVKDTSGIFSFRLPVWITAVVAVLMMVLPFVLYAGSQPQDAEDYVGKKIDFGIMDGHAGIKEIKTKADLKTGKFLVAFVSLTCPKCKLAVKRLRILKQMYPGLPLVLIMNGDDKDKAAFYQYTGAQDLEYIHFNGKEDYLRLSGPFLPNILVTDNGVVKARLDYTQLKENELSKYFDLKN